MSSGHCAVTPKTNTNNEATTEATNKIIVVGLRHNANNRKSEGSTGSNIIIEETSFTTTVIYLHYSLWDSW